MLVASNAVTGRPISNRIRTSCRNNAKMRRFWLWSLTSSSNNARSSSEETEGSLCRFAYVDLPEAGRPTMRINV